MPSLATLTLFLVLTLTGSLFSMSNPSSERADRTFKEAMGDIKSGDYAKAKKRFEKLAREFGSLSLSDDMQHETDRTGVNSYADLVKFRKPYLECMEKSGASREFSKASDLADKIIAALEKADSTAIAALAGCETRVGAWEAETVIYTPDELGKYFVGARATTKNGSAVPLVTLERKTGTTSFGIVLGGFSPYDPSIPNNLRIILLEKGRGWEWRWVIETKKENVKDVLTQWVR
jgi:hypothetical protein